jgi:thiamine-monophosphate kinase
MDEFGFIAKYLSTLAGPEGLDLKDDAAVWKVPKGREVVISMDTQVEGVHFPDGKFDAQTAEKLIRVNISDLTAKGADPLGYLLSLTLAEQVDEDALEGFCQGLASAQSCYGIKLWGGDTTRTKGNNVLTITLVGTVPIGKTVLRAGAQIGDLVCVTGSIGDSYLGLKTVLNQMDSYGSQSVFWEDMYHLPEPPFALRSAIRKYARAAVDISDGLLADAGHIADVSGVGMDIFLTTIPLSPASTRWVLSEADHQKARVELATGGDDYQVLMCISEHRIHALKKQAASTGIAITIIGKITDGSGVKCRDSQGNEVVIDKLGYTHF